MSRVELEGGGWFDPDRSKRIEWTGKRGSRSLWFTERGTAIRGGGRPAANPEGYELYYFPITNAQAVEFMLSEYEPKKHDYPGPHYLDGWAKARRCFPTEFPSVACDWLIRLGAVEEAKRLFPTEFPQIWAKHSADER